MIVLWAQAGRCAGEDALSGDTTTIYDPATGRIDYQFTNAAAVFGTYVAIATDYDLADTQPWTTYSITYDAHGNIQSTATT
jgi:hypothetical protein